jgi:hypothetical protein
MAEIDHLQRLAAHGQANPELESPFCGHSLTVQQAYEMRRDIASKTDHLHSDNLTPEQEARKLLHEGLTNALREAAPEIMANVEPLEEEMRNLENLKRLMEASMAAHPHDQGFQVLYGGLVLGAVIGWLRSKTIEDALVDGVLGGLAALFCSIFVLDSPYVQSVLGISANRIGLKQLGHWLYSRSLGFRPIGSGRSGFLMLFLLYTAWTAGAFLGSLEVISGDALIPHIPWLYPEPKAACYLCPNTRGRYVIDAQHPFRTEKTVVQRGNVTSDGEPQFVGPDFIVQNGVAIRNE